MSSLLDNGQDIIQVLIVNDTGKSGSKALLSKYSIYMLATTGEHGDPIAAPCNCL